MKIFIKIFVIFIIINLAYGCNLFTTRNPESPNTQKSSFIPPTSPNIVISNLTSSIKEKNTDSYISCLSDTSQGDLRQFVFYPNAEVYALYQSIFSVWSIYNEKRYFSSLMNGLPLDVIPSLTLTNSKYDILQSDSAVFTSDYQINLNYNYANLPVKLSGTMQIIMFPRKSGLWTIQRWIDTKSSNDSISSQTWSFLKSQFTN